MSTRRSPWRRRRRSSESPPRFLADRDMDLLPIGLLDGEFLGRIGLADIIDRLRGVGGAVQVLQHSLDGAIIAGSLKNAGVAFFGMQAGIYIGNVVFIVLPRH